VGWWQEGHPALKPCATAMITTSDIKCKVVNGEAAASVAATGRGRAGALRSSSSKSLARYLVSHWPEVKKGLQQWDVN